MTVVNRYEFLKRIATLWCKHESVLGWGFVMPERAKDKEGRP